MIDIGTMIGVLILTVFMCAVAMGLAWYGILEGWYREKFEDYALLAEDYLRREHKARMDAYMARRELAAAKGLRFDDDPPERRVSAFDMYVNRRRGGRND